MTTPDGEKPKRLALTRRTLRLLAGATTVVFLAALFGYVARDRTRWLAILMYLPMPLVAGVTMLVQAIAWERPRRHRRLVVFGIALLAGLVSVREMRGVGRRTQFVGLAAIPIVQWNVQWGRDGDGWEQTAGVIDVAEGEVIVLNEAPSDERLAQLCARLGPAWTYRVIRNPRGSRYWYAIAVLAKWPSEVEMQATLPNGAAMMVRVDRTDGPLRVLAVDGLSDPAVSRTPMLNAVAELCATAGPIDVVAGDFNSVSRSIGFDRLRAQGYELASARVSGWRATYPGGLPLYDIDHVWVGPRYLTVQAYPLDSHGTNHRGRVVAIRAR
jgi:endonuclease/exonuclease/phosphatase family metal-dependent hydrolase